MRQGRWGIDRVEYGLTRWGRGMEVSDDLDDLAAFLTREVIERLPP